jgi:hypothetical protein
MLGKPWDQLCHDEKIEELNRDLQDVRSRSNHNVTVGNQELVLLKDRLNKLEAFVSALDIRLKALERGQAP